MAHTLLPAIHMRWRPALGVLTPALLLAASSSCLRLVPTRFVGDKSVGVRARDDLPCDGPVKISPTVSGLSAEGCGRRVVYGEVICPGLDGTAHCAPKRIGEDVPPTSLGGETYTQRFVTVSQPVHDESRYGGEGFSGADAVRGAAFLATINAQAARDLSCSRGDVVPFVIPPATVLVPSFVPAGRYQVMALTRHAVGSEIPIAEGCGRRATYLPDKHLYLWSIVDMEWSARPNPP